MLRNFVISGEGFFRGVELGTFMRSATKKRIRLLKSFSTPSERKLLTSVFRKCEKTYPEYVEELIGYAAGAEVDFWDLFFLNCPEIREARHGCTTVVMPPFVGHNEDGDIGDTKNLCAMVTVENSFTAFHYAGELLGNAFSWNEHLFIAVSQLPDVRVQKNLIPRFFTTRALLDAKNISEVRNILKKGNASGYHYLVAEWGEKNIFSFETSLTKISEQKICSNWGHANHYLYPKFQHLQKKIPLRSAVRYNRLQELLPAAKTARDIL